MISVQIIHHENRNQKYLDNALKSLERQTYRDFEVIVMDSTVYGAAIPEWVRQVRVPRETTGPTATIMGTKEARAGTTHHMLCNDDLIFNKYALEEMHHLSGHGDIMINPFSNCDLGWLYYAEMHLRNQNGNLLPVDRFMDYSEVVGFEDAIIEYPRQSRFYLPQQQHCMYATLVPKRVWDGLGGYDENLLMGYNDTDLSWRYKQAGVQLLTCMSAFIWHYGGATTKDEPRKRQESDREYFKKKWNLPEHFDRAQA